MDAWLALWVAKPSWEEHGGDRRLLKADRVSRRLAQLQSAGEQVFLVAVVGPLGQSPHGQHLTSDAKHPLPPAHHRLQTGGALSRYRREAYSLLLFIAKVHGVEGACAVFLVAAGRELPVPGSEGHRHGTVAELPSVG